MDEHQPTRRSDQIRRRRTSTGSSTSQNNVSRKTSSRKSVAASSTRQRRTFSSDSYMPPVMVRNPTSTRAVPERRSVRKAKRRYDVAVGTVPGAEIRLPALPRIAVGWRLISFFLVALLGFTVYHLWTAPDFQVKISQVGGLQRMKNEDVNAVLNTAGAPIFTVDAPALEEKLLNAFPEFSAAAVTVGFPNTVAITITERIPLITWHQGGTTVLVDKDGVSFPVRSETDSLPSIVVEASGPPLTSTLQVSEAELLLGPDALKKKAEIPVKSKQLIDPGMVQAILALAEQVPQKTPLLYDGTHGLGWKDPRGWDVYFGDMKNVSAKLAIYKAIVKKLKEEDSQPKIISVEYINAPYYRIER